MASIKRSLDEVTLRYKIGQVSDREIFVEGLQDKIVLEHVLLELNLKGAVYTADSLEVPGSAIVQRGLELPSARSTIIAARSELSARGVDVSGHIFLVDRDQEDLVPTPEIEGVALTDYGSLLTHFVDSTSLEKLIRVVGRGILSADLFELSIYRICKDIYALRAAAKRLAIPLRILPAAGFIFGNRVDGYFAEAENYRRACLNSCGQIARDAELSAMVDVCNREIVMLNLDPRILINDHDLWVVMRTILRLAGDPVNRSSDDIRDLMLMGLDPSALVGTQLLRMLDG